MQTPDSFGAPRPRLWTPDGLAQFFDVPLSTVYRWRSTGSGPRGFRVGKYVRYDDAEVQAFIDQQRAKEAQPAG